MKTYTKRNKVVKVCWALQAVAKKMDSLNDLCNLFTIADANGIAVVQAGKHFNGEYDFTFDSFGGVYHDEIITGNYYFVPQDVWNEAFEIDEAQGRYMYMNRRMVLMKYATEKTYDEMKAAGF